MLKRNPDDSGIAMITAMMVIFVATILAVAALALAQHSLNASGIDRSRTQAVAAAEGGLDNAVYTLQNASASLPCSILPGSLPTSPAKSQYSVTVTYYSTNPPTGSPLPCTGSSLPSSPAPASAEIVSKAYTGVASATGRAMEALVTLTPVGGLNDAIFGHQIINFSNNATITRSPGSTPNADLYTDGNYLCSNNESVDGNVYAQGYISATGTCSVTGSWEAVGNVSTSNNSAVGGNIDSDATVSLSGNTSVTGNVYSVGYTLPGGHLGGTYYTGQRPTIPTQTFPQETLATVNSWTGYSVVTDNDCSTISGDTSSVYNQIKAMSTATSDTVISTDCALSWSNNTVVDLNHNLVIYSTQGFTTNNKVDFESTSNSATHNLEWIVPYDELPFCSSTYGNITTSNQTIFGNNSTPPNIDVMFYTPCNLNLSNKNSVVGQMYSDGTVTINNNWVMTYQQMPLEGATSVPTTSYIPEYDYKREVPYS